MGFVIGSLGVASIGILCHVDPCGALGVIYICMLVAGFFIELDGTINGQ
jgi:hypothetical protein